MYRTAVIKNGEELMRSDFVLTINYKLPIITCEFGTNPKFNLAVEELMSYLRYLCLFVYSGVKHILCCVFVSVLLFFVLSPVSLDCPFFCPFGVL